MCACIYTQTAALYQTCKIKQDSFLYCLFSFIKPQSSKAFVMAFFPLFESLQLKRLEKKKKFYV
ncbi:hypothetical protein BCV72DRAFT_136694 [Rhizopus microsporus var. microsporus]|uniref:Uncharacterized protein n=1 Tax=Rhizopus microsporus var. microsporus TaxID=86635 RepID=A0A1X0RFT7_RHIZD|nr:hypothetical protein BCV72DRAFT_136694 [Rhizopus microsporus var. microsporus]